MAFCHCSGVFSGRELKQSAELTTMEMNLEKTATSEGRGEKKQQ